MAKRIAQDEMGMYLAAYADGELDAAGSLEVLEHLASHPQAIARVVGQQRLRLAAERAVKQSTPPVPASLRERIAALAAAAEGPPRQTPAEAADTAGRRGARRFPWWVPVGAAACLTAGVVIGRLPPRRGTNGTVPQSVAPSSLVSAVTRTHVDCSRYADHFHQPEFPREVAAMPAALEQRLGRGAVCPDLSAIGYQFAGAGPCSLPGAETVHLLYRPSGADMADTISVFVQPDVRQVEVDPDKAYRVSAPDSPHPAFLWRTAGFVYYLVGDDAGTVERALRTITTPPNLQRT